MSNLTLPQGAKAKQITLVQTVNVGGNPVEQELHISAGKGEVVIKTEGWSANPEALGSITLLSATMLKG